MAKKMHKITFHDHEITIVQANEQDYISLTDIARHKKFDRTDDLIRNWIA